MSSTSPLPPKGPHFSVVIPAYNAGSYIQDCVSSVLAQTDPDFEVLVVDDGSIDDTAVQVRAMTDPRIRLIQRPNGGLAAARNTGIQAAQGELVAFLDADDRWCPEKLAAHRQAMDRHPEASVTYDWAAFIDAQGQPTGLCMAQSQIKLTHEALLLKNYLGNGSTSVVRRAVLQGVGGFDETLKRLVDHELWVRLTHGGHHIQLVPAVLTEYRTHDQSFTADTERMLQGIAAFLDTVATYAPKSVERLAPLVWAFTHRWMARAAFVAGNYDQARDHARQALKAAPQVLWRDPRGPITFAAIALQTITPAPLFHRLLGLGMNLTASWFKVRSRRSCLP